MVCSCFLIQTIHLWQTVAFLAVVILCSVSVLAVYIGLCVCSVKIVLRVACGPETLSLPIRTLSAEGRKFCMRTAGMPVFARSAYQNLIISYWHYEILGNISPERMNECCWPLHSFLCSYHGTVSGWLLIYSRKRKTEVKRNRELIKEHKFVEEPQKFCWNHKLSWLYILVTVSCCCHSNPPNQSVDIISIYHTLFCEVNSV